MLVIFRILGLFVKSLTPDDKYSPLNRHNLAQPIQTELAKKQKLSWEFFSLFLKSRSIFEHFEKKDDPHSLCISEITDCKRHCYINISKVRLQKTL